MNYYYDTEFLEGTQKTWKGESLPTIDLISIGIVAEDGREYYAISKDFNLKEAWNRYDEVVNKQYPMGPEYNRVYWIRENVLRPIYLELLEKEFGYGYSKHEFYKSSAFKIEYKDYIQLNALIKKYGKSNKQIAQEVKEFIYYKFKQDNPVLFSDNWYPKDINLYGYYSAYDHVTFCWLYGKMIDLPTGFPMYTIDLKQILDEKVSNMEFKKQKSGTINDYEIVKGNTNLNKFLDLVKGEGLVNGTYPKQKNEHSAIHDARWNKQLYEFIKQL